MPQSSGTANNGGDPGTSGEAERDGYVILGTRTDNFNFSSAKSLAEDALAFDHDEILAVALERIRGKIDYSDIAFELVPPTFTIPELRAVHEVVKGVVYDPGNFRRRFQRMMTDGIIEEAPGKRVTASKPARVYRFKRRRS